MIAYKDPASRAAPVPTSLHQKSGAASLVLGDYYRRVSSNRAVASRSGHQTFQIYLTAAGKATAVRPKYRQK